MILVVPLGHPSTKYPYVNTLQYERSRVRFTLAWMWVEFKEISDPSRPLPYNLFKAQYEPLLIKYNYYSFTHFFSNVNALIIMQQVIIYQLHNTRTSYHS